MDSFLLLTKISQLLGKASLLLLCFPCHHGLGGFVLKIIGSWHVNHHPQPLLHITFWVEGKRAKGKTKERRKWGKGKLARRRWGTESACGPPGADAESWVLRSSAKRRAWDKYCEASAPFTTSPCSQKYTICQQCYFNSLGTGSPLSSI